jgi:micrococcal nuclease
MTRYRSSRRPWVKLVLLVVILVAARYWNLDPLPDEPSPVAEGTHEVRRVVDGDTLLLESGDRVRLQGIDTPETVKEDTPVEQWGPEASAFTKQFVRDAGRQVRLTFGRERLDQYDRLLAFVWHDETLLNEELVRAGLARARLNYRYSQTMKRRLRAAEEEAKAARRGIWSDP